MNDNPRLQGRIALIAGASRGLGAAAAEALAAEGAHVILVARTQGALEALHDRIVSAGGKATIAPVDLTDGDASDRLALGIADRFQRLDILVQTAAILGVLSPIAHVPPETFEKTLAANVTAHWRLIRNFDALLKRSTGGRAIIGNIRCRSRWSGVLGTITPPAKLHSKPWSPVGQRGSQAHQCSRQFD